MVLGLHCCDLLTDLSLETSLKQNASFVIVPCCYGQVSKLPPSTTKSLDTTVSDTNITNRYNGGNVTDSSSIMDTDIVNINSPPSTDSSSTASNTTSHQYPTCLPPLSSGANFVYTFENITDDVILKQPTFLLAKRCLNIVDFDRLLHVCEKLKKRYLCKIDSIRPLSSSPKNNIIVDRYIQSPAYDTTKLTKPITTIDM